MAVPFRKTSKSKKNMRRSHHAIKINSNATCNNCGQPTKSHKVCMDCGFYKGKKVL